MDGAYGRPVSVEPTVTSAPTRRRGLRRLPVSAFIVRAGAAVVGGVSLGGMSPAMTVEGGT